MVRPLTPLIVYYTNYDYIVEELCENRNRPYLECNGTCYLDAMMERLEPQSKDTEPKSTVPLNMSDYPISTLDFYEYEASLDWEFKPSSSPSFNKHFVIKEYSRAIFHPPKPMA